MVAEQICCDSIGRKGRVFGLTRLRPRPWQKINSRLCLEQGRHIEAKPARHWWITIRCNLSRCWQQRVRSWEQEPANRQFQKIGTKAQRFPNALIERQRVTCKTATGHILNETRSASYIQPAIYASSPCDRQVGKHNIVPLSPRRLMIRLPTPKNRKRCLPPPGCHKLIHRALLRCQQTALVQTLYNNHVSRGSPGSRFALTCIETIRLRNTRLVLERRERSQVHCPLLRTQG